MEGVEDSRVELNVSVGDGHERQYRECVSLRRLCLLSRSLKEELNEERAGDFDLEERLRAKESGEASARWAEQWVSGVLKRDLSRRTRCVQSFFDEDPDGATSTLLVEAVQKLEDETNEAITTASYILMGAPWRYAALEASSLDVSEKKSRVVARKPLREGEAAAWTWKTKTTSANPKCRAVFLEGPEADHLGGSDLVFPYADHVDIEKDLSSFANEVRQDPKESIWSAPKHGTLYLVWDFVDPEDVLALKVATCDEKAASAASLAADDARRARDQGTFGERVHRASADIIMVRVFPLMQQQQRNNKQQQQQQQTKSITGLHIRDKIRATATRLKKTDDAFSLASESSEKRVDHAVSNGATTTEGSLEIAGQRLSALEDEAAISAARAERAELALALERAKVAAEAQANKKNRASLAALLKAAEDRAARAEAKANCAVAALRTLVDHELRPFVDAEEPPLVKNEEADRDWSRVECGDATVDAAALEARSAARRAAATVARQRAASQKIDKEKQRLSDEKRVLVAELRRLRGASDERLKGAKADADEARMMQRQLAARLSKLKKTNVALAKRLTSCTCDPDADLDDLLKQRRQTTKVDHNHHHHDDDDDDGDGDDARSAAVVDHRRQPFVDNTSHDDDDAGFLQTTDSGSVVNDGGSVLSSSTRQASSDESASLSLLSPQEKHKRRQELVAKLEGCRERQRKLEAILSQNPGIPHMRALKVKLDHAIITLGHQILALDGRDPNSGPPIFVKKASIFNSRNNKPNLPTEENYADGTSAL